MDANQPAVKKAVKNASKRIVKEFDVDWNNSDSYIANIMADIIMQELDKS